MDDFTCLTVDQGAHYPGGRVTFPGALGFTTQEYRTQHVRFEPSTANYTVPACQTSWNKLWGSSRCGLLNSHHEDSDRFVWRRAQGSDGLIEIAAYSYDGARRPFGPTDPNLLQSFSNLLLVGTPYLLAMHVEPRQTVFTLQLSNYSIESRTVLHAHTCTAATSGYVLGLYFGGSCPAPTAVTVCYQPALGSDRSGPPQPPQPPPPTAPLSSIEWMAAMPIALGAAMLCCVVGAAATLTKSMRTRRRSGETGVEKNSLQLRTLFGRRTEAHAFM